MFSFDMKINNEVTVYFEVSMYLCWEKLEVLVVALIRLHFGGLSNILLKL